MNNKSQTVKTAFGITKEDYQNISQEQERLSKETYEDEALKKFVKQPKELSLYDKFKIKFDFVLLFFLFGIIFFASVVGGIRNSMEAYVAFPIAILCLIGFAILIKDIKSKKQK